MKECKFKNRYGHQLKKCRGKFKASVPNQIYCDYCQKEAHRRSNYKNKVKIGKIVGDVIFRDNAETGLLELWRKCNECGAEYIHSTRTLFCQKHRKYDSQRARAVKYQLIRQRAERADSDIKSERPIVTISDLQRSTPVKFVSMVDDINSGKVVLGRI